MKFGEKLAKLRVQNEYSQEQLASTLEVETLEVSQWEAGIKYPEANMRLKICKIFNCDVEELSGDDVMENNQNENVSEQYSDEASIDRGIRGISDFITKSYSMIRDMDMTKRIVCACEVLGTLVILLVIGVILNRVVCGFMEDLIGYTKIGARITVIIGNILSLALQITGIVIWVKVYRIRYLDNYVLPEEEMIRRVNYQGKAKKKSILGDLKISVFGGFVGKIVMIILKICAVICVLPVVVLFVCLICAIVISIYHMQYGMIFLWVAVVFVGIDLLAFVLIDMAYKFISSEWQEITRILSIAITGLVIMGIGTGLFISTYIGFDKVDAFAEDEYLTKIVNIPMEDSIVFSEEKLFISEYEFDDSVNDIQIEMKYMNNVECTVDYDKSALYKKDYYITQDFKYLDTYKLILQDLKNHTIRDYSTAEYLKTTIVMSQNNYRKLQRSN